MLRNFINNLFITMNLVFKNPYRLDYVTKKIEHIITNDNIIHNNIQNLYFESRIKKNSKIIKKIQIKWRIPSDIYGIRIIYNNFNQISFAEKNELIDTLNICNYHFYNDLDIINLYKEFYAYYIHYLLIENFELYDKHIINDYINRPKDNGYNTWNESSPQSQGHLSDQNFLSSGHHFGINTVGQSLKNANQSLRSDPPIPQVAVGPWLQSTIEADTNRKQFEIGSC